MTVVWCLKVNRTDPEHGFWGSPAHQLALWCAQGPCTPSSGAQLSRHPQHPHLCFWGWSSRTFQQQQPPSQPASRKSSGQEATGQRRKGTEVQLSMRSWLPTCMENHELWAIELTLRNPPLSRPIHSLTSPGTCIPGWAPQCPKG